MKVIISHDIDHITALEHKSDLIIPKFILRSSIELLIRSISLSEFNARLCDILKNRFNNIKELMLFDRENDIPSTFFFAVTNGLGLSYSLDDAKYWIKKVLHNGFDVGVHGIEYIQFETMKKEFEVFREISCLDRFGIRMHYLRNDKETIKKLSLIGYLFDSTIYSLDNPYKINNIWEFPLHIMDGFLITDRKGWQTDNIGKIIDRTKGLIDKAYDNNLKYLTILFHDRYFSNSFLTWKRWYIWLISYFKDNKIPFISYKQAIKELEMIKQ